MFKYKCINKLIDKTKLHRNETANENTEISTKWVIIKP